MAKLMLKAIGKAYILSFSAAVVFVIRELLGGEPVYVSDAVVLFCLMPFVICLATWQGLFDPVDKNLSKRAVFRWIIFGVALALLTQLEWVLEHYVGAFYLWSLLTLVLALGVFLFLFRNERWM